MPAMLTLFCVIVGEGRPFPVDIAATATVHDLKSSIKAAKGYQFAAGAMDLFLAKKNGGWLNTDSAKAMTLSDCDSDLPLLDPTVSINALTLFGTNFQRNAGEVHVLVTLPPRAGTARPKVSVLELLRSRPLPDGLTLVDAMTEPLGFKVPVTLPELTSTWPNVFDIGVAEYWVDVDSFIKHECVGSGVTAVTARDASWLNVFQRGCKCTIRRDQSHPSNSRARTRPDAVIVRDNVLVGMCMPKAWENDMSLAALELTNKMAEAAYKTFPYGRMSIPAWATSPSRIDLHEVKYLSTTTSYRTTPLTTYFLDNEDDRVRFIVDVFKIMKWAFAARKPNALMRLVPGVRTRASNGHCVTWVKAGLVKEFHAADVDMALVQRIYDADLPHVERGRCNYASVTITSVGQTLENALTEVHLPRAVILAHVRAALDELHSINVAHCDVRAANVFILDDQRVILGDLEYCRPLKAAPPRVQCPPEDAPCKTAQGLDEYQYGKLQEELVKMGVI